MRGLYELARKAGSLVQETSCIVALLHAVLFGMMDVRERLRLFSMGCMIPGTKSTLLSIY